MNADKDMLRQQAGRVDEESLRATAQAMREEAENGSNAFRDMMHGYADSIETALAQNTQGENNALCIDRGALQMALNVLRRAGKNEVADELEKACYLHAERARVPDADVRWLLEQARHNEFSHSYIKDEKACDTCQRIKRIAAMLAAAPSQRAEVARG